MLLFSLLVAGSFSLGKLIASDVDPVAITTFRFVLAALLMAVALAASGRPKLENYREPWRYFVLGGLFLAYFVLMFEALKTASPVSTAAVFTTMPLAAAAMDRAFFGRGSPLTVWSALLVGACGALWVIFRGSWDALVSLDIGYGEFLFFVGVLLHAAYAVLIPRLGRSEPLHAMTFGVTAASALILMTLFWPRIAATDWMSMDTRVWAILIYLAVMATLGTFALISVAAARLTSAKVTAYTYLTPIWVVLLESGLGHGLPGPTTLMGGLPILAALVILFLERS